jgi:restriction endonuclease Mrr
MEAVETKASRHRGNFLKALIRNCARTFCGIAKTIKECLPAFFERLVIDVLVKMGYGGFRKEAGKAIGRT